MSCTRTCARPLPFLFAGDVLLMAVRAEDGQPRSYLIDSIIGVSPTQTTFSPRYLSRDNLDETGATIWMRRGGRVK